MSAGFRRDALDSMRLNTLLFGDGNGVNSHMCLLCSKNVDWLRDWEDVDCTLRMWCWSNSISQEMPVPQKRSKLLRCLHNVQWLALTRPCAALSKKKKNGASTDVAGEGGHYRSVYQISL